MSKGMSDQLLLLFSLYLSPTNTIVASPPSTEPFNVAEACLMLLTLVTFATTFFVIKESQDVGISKSSPSPHLCVDTNLTEYTLLGIKPLISCKETFCTIPVKLFCIPKFKFFM